jgi:hypothetical protein
MSLQINDTKYSGTFRDIFISSFVTGFDSMKKGVIAVLPGIKLREAIPTLEVTNIIQPRIEGEITEKHSGRIDIDERNLVPQDVMIFLLFNPRKFEAHWTAVQMNPNLLDAELPKNAEAAITARVMELASAYLEKAVWQSVRNSTAIADAIANGFADNANRYVFFNGYLVRMLNDSNVIKIASPVVLTKTNIIAKMEEVKLACPVPIKDHPNLKFLMNPKTFEIYESAQQGQNFKGANVTDAGKRSFSGKEIIILSGLPDDTIVHGVFTNDLTGNLWFGVNEPDEQEVLELKRHRPESEQFFLKGLLKIDANYAKGTELVLYTTWEAPSTYEFYN